MKRKTLLALIMLAATSWAWAGDGDKYFSLNAGFLVPNTLNVQFGFEKELKYGNAIELYGEAGNRYRKDPVCGKFCSDTFWDGYYWAGGASYKKAISKGKNSLLRFRIGPVFGAYKGDFSYGVDLSFEYNIQLENGIQIVFTQKNQINFNYGDDFRNGILVGFKCPI